MDIGGRNGVGAHTRAWLAVSWGPSILEIPNRSALTLLAQDLQVDW